MALGGDGRREIGTTKQRVALTKKWMKYASDAAKSAQSQLRTARNEVAEAESSLKSVEERLKVIDIDADVDSTCLSKMPSDGKGRREIDAAKQCLVMTKKWAKSAANAVEFTTDQLRSAQRETNEAESLLKDCEERCEVIDIDSGDDDDALPSNEAVKNEGGRKRQRTLLLSQECVPPSSTSYAHFQAGPARGQQKQTFLPPPPPYLNRYTLDPWCQELMQINQHQPMTYLPMHPPPYYFQQTQYGGTQNYMGPNNFPHPPPPY